MTYSALYIRKNSRTLYVLGVVALMSFFIAGVFFVRQLGRQNGWQKTTGIERMMVVNRSPHGFEVVWSTRDVVKDDQWVEVGSEKYTYQITKSPEYIGGIYRATITDLKPDTTYYFRVRVGARTYILPSLVPTSIHTPGEVKEKPVSPAYGKVILPSTRPYSNGLLVYEIDGYYPLSTITKETGEWLIPLTGLVEKKSNKITPISDVNQVLITLFSYPKGTVRALLGQTRPLKQAITAGASIHIAQTVSTPETVLGAYTQNSSQKSTDILTITYPKENAIIPGNTPLIRGTGPIGKDISILIQGPTKQYGYRVKADATGNWLVQYPLVLEAGKYTINVTGEDGEKKPIILKRSFSIIKSGEQVLGVATGSPTLIPTSPVIPTYASPSITPTSILYPTTVVPTRFIPTATPPVTGGGMSGFLLGSLLCIVIGAGLVIAF